MFLKRHVRQKDGKRHVYFSLCESTRVWLENEGAIIFLVRPEHFGALYLPGFGCLQLLRPILNTTDPWSRAENLTCPQ